MLNSQCSHICQTQRCNIHKTTRLGCLWTHQGMIWPITPACVKTDVSLKSLQRCLFHCLVHFSDILICLFHMLARVADLYRACQPPTEGLSVRDGLDGTACGYNFPMNFVSPPRIVADVLNGLQATPLAHT